MLDAWAVLALLRGEAAAERVRDLVAGGEALMCSINLGEVNYVLIRTHGEAVASEHVEGVRQVIRVEDPDWPLVRAAAQVKAGGGLSYADAFGVATAQRHSAPLATGDPELLAVHGLVETLDLRAAVRRGGDVPD